MKKIDRRTLLKRAFVSTLAVNPIVMLIQARINNLYAQETAPENEKHFINFHFGGGPPRWMYDLPLMPNGANDLFNSANPMTTTHWRDGQLRGDYKNQMFSDLGVNMPWMWSKNIATPSGTASMSDLLSNMMMIRGYSSGSDGHTFNTMNTIAPFSSAPSIAGLFADAGSLPLRALGLMTKERPFFSAKGISELSPGFQGDNLDNMFQAYIDPFKVIRNEYSDNATLEGIIDDSLNILSNSLDSRNVKLRGAKIDRLSAKAVIKDDLNQFAAEFEAIKNKYLNLQGRTLSQVSLGTGVDSGAYLQKSMNPNIPDVYYRAHSDQNAPGNLDLNGSFNSESHIDHLAEAMALSEFMVKRNLSNSIVNKVSYINANYGSTSRPVTIRNDAHYVGAICNLYYFSKYFQAFHSCLHELCNSLAGKFEHSIIYLTGDFNRYGLLDGSGSNHGWNGSNVTLISGAINRPIIVGDTHASDQRSSEQGSWGKAAPCPGLNNKAISMGNIFSTICHLGDITNNVSANSETLLTGDRSSLSGAFPPVNRE